MDVKKQNNLECQEAILYILKIKNIFWTLEIVCSILLIAGGMTLPGVAAQPVSVQQDLPPGGDEDSDGVPNGKDRCPYRSGPLTNYGCPTGDDEPAETPESEEPARPVFPEPDDSDGDGTADPEDLCPSIPGNGLYSGCVDRDQDDDGIQNVNDECPVEAGSVDNSGCPDDEAGTTVPVLPVLPAEGCAIATQATDGVFVRSEPTTDSDNVIDVLNPAQIYTGTQRLRDNSWLYIDALNGWVASRVVRSTSECNSLPTSDNTQVRSLTPPDSDAPDRELYCVMVPESYRWTPMQTPAPYPASQATDRNWRNVEGHLILDYGGSTVDRTPTRDYGTGRLAYVPRPSRALVGFVRGWNKSQIASQTRLIASGYVEYRGLFGDQGDSYEGTLSNAPVEVYGPRESWPEPCGSNPANPPDDTGRELYCVVAETDYMYIANQSESPASEASEHNWKRLAMYLELRDDRRILDRSGLTSDATPPFTISPDVPLAGLVMAVSKPAVELRTGLRVKGFVTYKDPGFFSFVDTDEFEGWVAPSANLSIYGPDDSWPENCGDNPYQVDISELLPAFQINPDLIPPPFSTEETCYYYIGVFRNTGSSAAQVSVWFTSNINSAPLSGTYTRSLQPGETDRIRIADTVELVSFLEFRVRTRYAEGIEIMHTIFGTQAIQHCENNEIYDEQLADNPD